MALTRRAFLQQTSAIVAGLGLSDTALSHFSRRYRQVLAQPTPRKLALLVGINQYGSTAKLPALKGCITDLDLQRELLIHRFGFHASDIQVLSNNQATRSNIEAAFTSHLINQARPHDVVVFHFSGYGCRMGVRQPAPIGISPTTYRTQNALIPVDARLPISANHPFQISNGLGEDTLLLLLRSLKTKQITSVLDTGFSYPGSEFLGHLRVRSLPEVSLEQMGLAELSLQERLLALTGLSRDRLYQSGLQIPGLVLAAAPETQTAVEAQWHDFTAGLLTYALTQELWHTTPATAVSVNFSQVAADMEQRVGSVQQPEIHFPAREKAAHLTYGLSQGPSAEGILLSTNETGQSAQVWLGGLPSTVLDEYGTAACFRVLPSSQALEGDSKSALLPPHMATTPAPDQPVAYPTLHLQSRQGLKATGQLPASNSLQAGQYVQEAIRVISRTPALNVAFSPDLDRIERVDATSALSGMSGIVAAAADQPADCLFAKVAASPPQGDPQGDQIPDLEIGPAGSEPTASTSTSYGLCSLGGELLPNTRGEPAEAVKTAARRLQPMLELLLASKLLRLTVNHQSSRLGMRVTLDVLEAETPHRLMHQQTPRAVWPVPEDKTPLSMAASATRVITLAPGSRVRYRLSNYSDRPIYWVILGFDTNTRAFTCEMPVLNDNPGVQSPELNSIAPGSTLTIPASGNEWVIHGPMALATTYLICSRFPFRQTFEGMPERVRSASANNLAEVVVLSQPLEIAQRILEDLHQASAASAEKEGISHESGWALDVDQWVTFQFVHQVG